MHVHISPQDRKLPSIYFMWCTCASWVAVETSGLSGKVVVTLLITWRKQSKISKLQRSIMTSFGKQISSSKSLVLCFVPWCILPIHWGKVPLKILPSHLHLDDNQWNPQRYPTPHKGSTVKPGILQIFNHPSGRADPNTFNGSAS